MKSLSLYVDKWFITVAINFDGNVMPLSLPNGEDRIWLYFHEDIANSQIEYGKAFENCYRDKQPHYFGDIFKMIEEGDSHFTRYEGRREEMREVFAVSGIFNHLRQAIEEDGLVDTYISFSTDIPDVARLRFIEELEESQFKVVESVARISHLALEECKMRNIFNNLGSYLVLVATNDNFHISLYENKGDIFLRKGETTLLGLGLDVRRRALVETIVENINKNTRLLKSREEFDAECVRQDRFAPEWLEKIARSRPYMPVAFDGITFAVAPHNPAIVQVFPNKLNERTIGIVDEMVRKIAEFVKCNQLLPHEIEGIVFIGNTFTNQTFATTIQNKFIIDNDKIVIYREDELPKVVTVYSQLDCDQFKGATLAFLKDAEAQAILIQQAKEEAEKRKKAEDLARSQQVLIEMQKKAEREYHNAVENIERYESDRNYEEMLSWTEIALANKPEDEYAKGKETLARQLLAEQKAAIKQFNTIAGRIKTAFTEERWADVVSQCDLALELRPNSEEISRLKAEARRRMDVKEKVRDFLNRAEMLYARKLYTDALREVNKILNLDSSNQEAKQIKSKISNLHARHQETINNLIEKLTDAEKAKDYVAAIQICESLIDEDPVNIRKWMSRKERFISNLKETKENKRKLDDLKQDIDNAFYSEDWIKLKLLCENYLAIESDSRIAEILAKAKKRLENIKVKESKDKALATINKLIIERRISEAQKEVDRFAQNYPSEHSVVKDLRRKLFSVESQERSESTDKPQRKPIGFGVSTPVDKNDADDFFGTPAREPRQAQKTTSSPLPKKQTTDEDDFFDSASNSSDNFETRKHKTTNNDFNF